MVRIASVIANSKSLSLWRHRDFLVLWAGQSVALVGSHVTTLALPLMAITLLGASPFQVGLLTTCATLPWLLLSLPVGLVVDRTRKRTLLLWCESVRVPVLASIPVAAALDVLTLGQLYAVTFISGTCSVAFNAAYLSLPSIMLGDSKLVDANSKFSVSSSIANVAGPAVGGFLVGVLGAARAVAVDAATCVVSVVTLFLVRHREPKPRRPPATGGLLRELTAGLRLLVENRSLVFITFTNSFGGFVVAGIATVWIPFAVLDLGWSAQEVGLVAGVGAVGGLVGSLLAKPLIDRFGLVPVLLGSPIAFAPGHLVAGTAPSGAVGMVVAAAGFATAFAGLLVYNIAQRSYRLLSCPRDRIGRVNAAVNWVQWGLRPLAGLTAGALGTWVGLRPAVLAFACLLPLCAIALWFSPLRAERPRRMAV
ncbi:MFS transporter [Actinosynnema pretiosum]|uniref:MFS transporter n=1 Tax=Actinosynnema pretiosum TaxID=42197 RepID=UPI002810E057|nr:MFS transporter [Actinosynnema pretiosum]